MEQLDRSLRRRGEKERKKYNSEWVIICEWFITKLFTTDNSYNDLFMFADKSWRAYCKMQAKQFKHIIPNEEQFNEQFRAKERNKGDIISRFWARGLRLFRA